MKRRIASVVATLALGTAGSLAFVQSASATSLFSSLCNSSGSVEPITVYAPDDGMYQGWLNPGACFYGLHTANTRVDTDPAGGVDTDSYRIKSDSTWGPCHVGETNSSDPPNVADVVYKNYTTSNCNGNG